MTDRNSSSECKKMNRMNTINSRTTQLELERQQIVVLEREERNTKAATFRTQVDGKPKSGRKWKTIQQSRSSASSRKKESKGTAWERQEKRRKERKRMKDRERALIEKRKEKKREKRERRLANRKRKIENEMKSTTVQEITRLDKLKTMNKKQLKKIRRTSVRADGTVELVPLYGARRG